VSDSVGQRGEEMTEIEMIEHLKSLVERQAEAATRRFWLFKRDDVDRPRLTFAEDAVYHWNKAKAALRGLECAINDARASEGGCDE
jgi:hypothetical protein